MSREGLKCASIQSGSQNSSQRHSLNSSVNENIGSIRGGSNLSNNSEIMQIEPELREKTRRRGGLERVNNKEVFCSNPRTLLSSSGKQKAAGKELEKQEQQLQQYGEEARRIKEFYQTEKEKMNIWTFLFKTLNHSFKRVLAMCELEGKSEFCLGAIEMLDSYRTDLMKLNHKIKVEESEGKFCAWDINQYIVLQDQTEAIFDEYKNSVQDVTEEEEIEFNLLEEMVDSGKMSLYEAIVLIIRERALVLDCDQPETQLKSVNVDSQEINSDRSRSFSPDKVPFSRLKKRLLFKAMYLKHLNEADTGSIEGLTMQELEQRQLRAQSIREEIQNKKMEKLMKTEERSELARKKREESEKELIDEINYKAETGIKRRNEIINEKVRKARQENMKTKELVFLAALEKEIRKTTIDKKLLETHQRRMQILDSKKKKQKVKENVLLSVQLRKEEIDNEKKSQLQVKIDKFNDAEKRRRDILDSKAKKSRAMTKGRLMKGGVGRLKKRKTMNDLIKDFMNSQNNIVDNDELEVKSCQANPPQIENERRSKSLYHELDDIIDYPFLLFYKHKIKDPLKNKISKVPIKKEEDNLPKKKAVKSKKPTVKKEMVSSLNTKKSTEGLAFGTKGLEKKKTEKNFDTPNKKDNLKKSLEEKEGMESNPVKEVAPVEGEKAMGTPKKLGKLEDEDLEEESVFKVLDFERVVSSRSNNRTLVRWCTLCDILLIEEVTNDQHLQSKQHKKLKNQYSLTVNEEKTCILTCLTIELAQSRIVALKKMCKRIRQNLGALTSKNENLSFGKENLISPNKTRLQKYSVELEKLVENRAKDFKAIDTLLKEVQKVLANNSDNDLHILRANKFISHLIEICRSVNVCQKHELGTLVKVIDSTSQLLYMLSSVRENRTYLVLTNRVIPLVDLLLWSWNNTSKYIYCLNYIPQLFHLIGFLLKHKLPECKEMFSGPIIEYIMFCGLLLKLKQRFTSFNSGLELTSYAGKIPLAVLKAISLLETITALMEVPNIPFFNQSRKLNESIAFLLRETELVGCLQLMSGILLSGGDLKKLTKKYVLPQTIFSVVMLIIKIFCNVARLEINLIQEILGLPGNIDQLYHCVLFILEYSITNCELNEEIPELLNETILLLGYFTYLNPANQAVLSRGHGSNNIISKLVSLPFNYFVGNTLEKDVLFPTLVCIVFRNPTNLKLLLEGLSADHLTEYIHRNIQMVNKHRPTCEGNFNDPNVLLGLKEETLTSKSGSSAHSSANSIRLNPTSIYHYLMAKRFNYELWQEAIEFIESHNTF